MSLVKDILSEQQFNSELSVASSTAGVDRLVVVDFYADWCGPCKNIAPFLRELSVKYPHVSFLKVNVDKLPDIAVTYNISAMPTFLYMKNGKKVDDLTGADPAALESKVIQHAGAQHAVEGDVAVKGQMDLVSFLSKSSCECLNEANSHGLSHALEKGSGYLLSDTDEQLIIFLVFNQVVKIHSLRFDAPDENGPKIVKLFVNQTAPPDFESCSLTQGTQELELTRDDLKESQVTALKFVKFQSVSSLTIFVQDNVGGTDATRINYLALYGRPMATTNMNELKKVAGKQGETSS